MSLFDVLKTQLSAPIPGRSSKCSAVKIEPFAFEPEQEPKEWALKEELIATTPKEKPELPLSITSISGSLLL